MGESGLKVRLVELVSAVSEAMDFMSPEIVGHHRRVAFITDAIARQIALSDEEHRDVLLGAALHDCGAFSLRERLDLQEFETRRPYAHAEAGYRLLRIVPDLQRAALSVRWHHLPWAHGRGGERHGEPVPIGSQIIHLADRVSVLVKATSAPETQARPILRLISARAGAVFVPELVRAFEEAAAAPDFWLEAAHPPSLEHEELFGSALVSEADLMGLVSLFWRFVDFRSPFTASHTSGVVAVAQRLSGPCGVEAERARDLSVAAAMHDLGKLSVPAEILEKPGPLSGDEWSVMQRHPARGFTILEKLPAFRQINAWANYHHEKLSGKGYPFRLAAGEIPLESRIVSVADVFTALTEDRPYRKALGGPHAVGILHEMVADGSLDPALVGIAARNGDSIDEARRTAQENAGASYNDFLAPVGPEAGALGSLANHGAG